MRRLPATCLSRPLSAVVPGSGWRTQLRQHCASQSAMQLVLAMRAASGERRTTSARAARPLGSLPWCQKTNLGGVQDWCQVLLVSTFGFGSSFGLYTMGPKTNNFSLVTSIGSLVLVTSKYKGTRRLSIIPMGFLKGVSLFYLRLGRNHASMIYFTVTHHI